MRTGERLMTFGAGGWDKEVMSGNRSPSVGTAALEVCSVSHLRNTGRGALLSGPGLTEAEPCCWGHDPGNTASVICGRDWALLLGKMVLVVRSHSPVPQASVSYPGGWALLLENLNAVTRGVAMFTRP